MREMGCLGRGPVALGSSVGAVVGGSGMDWGSLGDSGVGAGVKSRDWPAGGVDVVAVSAGGAGRVSNSERSRTWSRRSLPLGSDSAVSSLGAGVGAGPGVPPPGFKRRGGEGLLVGIYWAAWRA
ncbi:MAG: hypothetical protein AAF750_11985, partial [Planctomycetota bacterium]